MIQWLSLGNVFLNQDVLTTPFAWLMEQLHMRVGWNCAIMASGELFATISGIAEMPMLYADNWE